MALSIFKADRFEFYFSPNLIQPFSIFLGLITPRKSLRSPYANKEEWNDRHGCWSSLPLHNFASHEVHAFRMLAVGMNKLASKGLSAEERRSLRQQYIV